MAIPIFFVLTLILLVVTLIVIPVLVTHATSRIFQDKSLEGWHIAILLVVCVVAAAVVTTYFERTGRISSGAEGGHSSVQNPTSSSSTYSEIIPFDNDTTTPETIEPATENDTDIQIVKLPDNVFDFKPLDAPSRRSYEFGPDDAESTAYAYRYWEDSDSISMSATASAGGSTSTVVANLMDSDIANGQRTLRNSTASCVWGQDSDPNTPMHSVKCYRVDGISNRAMIVRTITRDVGDPAAQRLIEEVWNTTTWS